MARGRGLTVSVISWHAPNAAAEGVEVKMADYRAVLEAVDRSHVNAGSDHAVVCAQLVIDRA